MATETSECPFCKISAAWVSLANDVAFVQRDGYPVSKGHTLIIPRRHVESFFDCTAEERQGLLSLLVQAKEQLDEQCQPDGYNVGINDGQTADQTVMHLHIHLVPRYTGNCADPRGGIRWIFPEKANYWHKQ